MTVHNHFQLTNGFQWTQRRADLNKWKLYEPSSNDSRLMHPVCCAIEAFRSKTLQTFSFDGVYFCKYFSCSTIFKEFFAGLLQLNAICEIVSLCTKSSSFYSVLVFFISLHCEWYFLRFPFIYLHELRSTVSLLAHCTYINWTKAVRGRLTHFV